MSNWEIELKGYDGKDKGVIIHIGEIARSITDEQLAKLLDEYLNVGFKGMRNGENVGKHAASFHRTLQRSFIGFLIGALVGIVEANGGTDPRNEAAIRAARKVHRMHKDGELNIGPMI